MFRVPEKVLKDKSHIPFWEKSEAYLKLISFISTIGEAVKSTPLSQRPVPSKAVQRVLTLLEGIDALVEDTPPAETALRFGNPAFRDFHAKLTENCEALLGGVLDGAHKGAVRELKPYLLDSFGNPTRIDYGSGHELAFVALLCCLGLMKVFHQEDTASICLHIFHRYLQLVRKIQTKYKQEPAGSHGVWGLDDYQFLCYYWGAAQLIGQSEFSPKDIPQKEKALQAADEFMFFGAIKFIFENKTGPFFEHSKYLFDISGVPSWSKVHSGLLKMYKAEVLSKLPVVQHFFFGYLLPIDVSALPNMDKESSQQGSTRSAVSSTGMNAFGKTWGGPVPSKHGASDGDDDDDGDDSNDSTQDKPTETVTSSSTGLPMTTFPKAGAKHVENEAPIAMRTGGARVAEKGSFAKK